ncbi:polysaccharide deacetylase family protein [Melghirimyces algeriensis]|uniref:polysaccharide deacetylase family protein n=1 Tax=Melghirimyces algeriensis TaxID=910412 RepID=UPI001FE6942C|nr:polysaccharide deacetylase family protein [Melghirimyces algeriensis]
MRRLQKRWLIPVMIIVWLAAYSPSVTAYVQTVKSGAPKPVFNLRQDHELQKMIEQGARVRYEPPVNARVDRVWKAIPGYNGIEVDQDATYRLTVKQKKKKPIRWVYREVAPQVTMDQLGAQPIYRGNEKKPMVAFMINVAWGTKHLPRMLEILKEEGVHATFFLDGSWLKKHPNRAKKLIREGHEIGNHGYSHPMMSRVSRQRVQSEIRKTEDLINQLGVSSHYFAPPAGDFNRIVLEEAHQMKMKTVLWTVDTVDWRKSVTPEMINQRVANKVSNGSLILMHPTSRTVEALPKMIRTIKKKGLKLGTVDEVLSPRRVKPVEDGKSF